MEHAQVSTSAPERQPHSEERADGADDSSSPLVAFDFDGTLTTRDSFIAFLIWRVGVAAFAAGLIRLAPALLRYGLDRDRGRLKAAAVAFFLKGRPAETTAAEAERFAAAAFDRLIRPDALARFTAETAARAETIIVTASPELLVAPFARRLGAARLIGTRLAVDDDGVLTGALAGLNCRGPEKVARIRAAYGPRVRLARAYGDTRGDLEMLAAAGEGFYRVFRGRP